MAIRTTLLDLVTTLSETIESEAELIEVVVRMVNGGTVELTGNFRGARFDPDSSKAAA